MTTDTIEATSTEEFTVWGDENCVTAEEVALVEDLQEIQAIYSRRAASPKCEAGVQTASLDSWAFDLSQRLNNGDVTVENIVNDFRASLADQDHLAFTPIGHYALTIERDNPQAQWVPVLHNDTIS